MDTSKLHYIYDPLCGWCYGAAELVKAARDVLPVQAHGGGMMTGARRQPVSAQLRDYVMPHDHRIAQLTGQPFGTAYFEGLLRDNTAVFDSAPPTAAILATETLAQRGLDMLALLQTAHYVEGQRIADHAVLLKLAGTLGLDTAAFAQALEQAEGAALDAHIADTRRLMASLGAQGFPSFALEHKGQFTVLDVSRFLGEPQKLRSWLISQLPAPEAASASGAQFGCGPDSCAI
ncbi:DsbA family protein [Pseudoduganella sp. FT93W]|uniref:DsbA family protein n=1 Tax=Duganella fentianensis TaxID=2692177 RepID=A0A845HWC1_9BURK|nr:DsbA family protein [Duganella fentianensis]MYN45313.1 DsbA family protein [Duganella fentianensis]